MGFPSPLRSRGATALQANGNTAKSTDKSTGSREGSCDVEIEESVV